MLRLLICAVLVSALSTSAHSQSEWAEFAEHQGKLVIAVAITGNQVTKDYVIWREIETRKGDELDVRVLAADFIRLENLGIFSSIDITVLDEGGDAVSVGYEVQEMPWLIPSLRIKYTEQDGFSVGPSLVSLNLFGRAMYASGYAVFGGTNQFAVAYRWPWITADHLSVDAWTALLDRFDNLNEFKENSFELRPWMGIYVGRRGRARGMIGLFAMNSDRDGITLSDDRRDRFWRAGLSVGFDSRDSWRQTERGWWFEVLLEQWTGINHRPGDWYLGQIDVRRWTRIVPNHFISAGILFSSNTGTVDETFPSYLMYRLGGSNSIRGYDIEKLGRELVGQNQFIFTTEYQYTFMPLRVFEFFDRWSVSAGMGGALFIDYGDAWKNEEGFEFDHGKFGAGFGLRLLVPGINMVRLDIGFGETGEVFFHLGMNDKYTAQRERLR
jgi:outer membrane protein assembly factor BamA